MHDYYFSHSLFFTRLSHKQPLGRRFPDLEKVGKGESNLLANHQGNLNGHHLMSNPLTPCMNNGGSKHSMRHGPRLSPALRFYNNLSTLIFTLFLARAHSRAHSIYWGENLYEACASDCCLIYNINSVIIYACKSWCFHFKVLNDGITQQLIWRKSFLPLMPVRNRGFDIMENKVVYNYIFCSNCGFRGS